MEHEDVPALAREVREERCDHEDYVLTEQQLVGTLHFPTCRGQKLRHANENAGKHLADETPLHDLRSLLASPKLPDHIGHEKGQEIAHDGTWDDDGRTEERESCHDGSLAATMFETTSATAKTMPQSMRFLFVFCIVIP